MPKTVDHDEYRKELLAECFELFSQKGYGNVTMREIARTTGVSTGTLYHYFPNKISILEALFAWAAQKNIEDYNRISNEGAKRKEKLDIMGDFLVASKDVYLNHLALSLDLLRNSPNASEDVLYGYGEAFKSAICEILGTNEVLAEVIFVYLLGSATHAKLTPTRFSFERSVEHLKEAIRNSEGKGQANLAELSFQGTPSAGRTHLPKGDSSQRRKENR